jgi:hypothetical protein
LIVTPALEVVIGFEREGFELFDANVFENGPKFMILLRVGELSVEDGTRRRVVVVTEREFFVRGGFLFFVEFVRGFWALSDLLV